MSESAIYIGRTVALVQDDVGEDEGGFSYIVSAGLPGVVLGAHDSCTAQGLRYYEVAFRNVPGAGEALVYIASLTAANLKALPDPSPKKY